MRLIDADKLKEELENWAATLPDHKAFGRSETFYLIDYISKRYDVIKKDGKIITLVEKEQDDEAN